MAMILTQKLVSNGWPQDEEMKLMDEALLEKRGGAVDNDNEYTIWTEWCLDGRLVHRSAHVTFKRNVVSNTQIGGFSG
jgi:hypothetical protein